MKKILAVILAVLMIASCFAACGGKKPPETTPNQGGIPDQHTHTFVDGKCTCGASDPNYNATHQHTFVDGKCECGETDPSYTEEIVFTDVDEIVYVNVATLTLRATTEFGIETNIKGYASLGAELKRTGYHKDWSRVEYNGETVYCATNCLTTTNPNPTIDIVFTDVNEYVLVDTTANKAEDGTYPDARYYLFPKQGVDEYVAGFLDHGTKLLRTGVYYEPVAEGATDEGLGWSRIEIDGKDYYIRNSVVKATGEVPAGLPEGYVEYNNGAISFARPEAWTLVDGAMVQIFDAVTENAITVSFNPKSDVWASITAEAYATLMNEQLAAVGMSVSNVTVEQLTTANGEAVTKISYIMTMTATGTTLNVPTVQLLINAGENDYNITIAEVVAVEGLVDTVFATLKSVQ